MENIPLYASRFPWIDRIHFHATLDSTNTEAKRLAVQGAPEGTTVIAEAQTGGRGRLGHSFHSPAGKGLYLSTLLRPNCSPGELMHLTCAAAVAVCDATEAVCGLRPGIKWTNDLVHEGKKLGGILTELSVNRETGLVDWAIAGIGINCSHTREDFPPELQDMAASLSMFCSRPVSRASLSSALVFALYQMSECLLTQKEEILTSYKADCITLGQEVLLVKGEEKAYGTALDIDSEGGLVVRFRDGRTASVTSGEVSVRGMYGYI